MKLLKVAVPVLVVLGAAYVGLRMHFSGNPDRLCMYVKDGNQQMVKISLMFGADPDAPDTEKGWTPLQYAASSADVPMAKELLDGGAKVDFFKKGAPPLYTVVYHKELPSRDRLKIIQLLLTNGANADKGPIVPGGHHELTALTSAIIDSDLDVASLLLKHGADPNLDTTGEGVGPLYLAAEMPGDQAEMVALILKHGADPLRRLTDPKSLAKYASDHPEFAPLIQQRGGIDPLLAARIAGNRRVEALIAQAIQSKRTAPRQ